MKEKNNREESELKNNSIFNIQYSIYFITIGVFVIIGVVYLITLLSLYPALPITTERAENIPSYVEVYPPFRVDEVNYYTIAKNIINGEVYREGSPEKSFTIGFPLLAVPFIAIWDKMGGYIANMVIVWFSALVFYLILKRYTTQLKALIMTLILAFTTLNWFYAVSCYTEPFSQLLILLAFYFLTWEKTSKRLQIALFFAGIMTGLNLFVRPHYILIAVPFFIFYWMIPRKKPVFQHVAFWYAGGTALIVMLWLIRNQIFFGNPLSFEYSRMVNRLTGTTDQHYTGNIFWGTHRLFFNEFHGLFTITPILLIFPAGLKKMWESRVKKEMFMLLGSVIIITLFIASSPYPYTDFGLGSRHMMPIIPLMLFPVVFFLENKTFPRIIITLLAVYSFYHAGLGWFTGRALYVGEKGFFVGLLHERVSEAIILSRKGLIPKREFKTREELFNFFMAARTKCDYMRFFQSLHPDILKQINGYERPFVNFIRQHPRPDSLIMSINPKEGIMIRNFQFTPAP